MLRAFILGAMMGAAATSIVLPASPVGAVVAKDWTKTVVVTPEGGFRVGNPAARLKLVEYGSLTCDHCANFARDGMPELLSKYVKGGGVSFEFRNFVRDPFDLTGALLSRCAGPSNFFALTDRIFATQEAWIGRVSPQAQAIQALPPGEQLGRVASASGLGEMAAKAGVTPAHATQCLNDKTQIDRLVAMRKVAAEAHDLTGTPTFLLNGKTLAARNWATLQPLLGPPGG